MTVLSQGYPAAWVGRSYVTYRDGTTVEVPGFVARGDGAGLPGTDGDAWGQTCGDCFQARSFSGCWQMVPQDAVQPLQGGNLGRPMGADTRKESLKAADGRTSQRLAISAALACVAAVLEGAMTSTV